VLVKQTGDGSGEAFEMDTEGTLEWLSKPTVVNTTIIADKQADDDTVHHALQGQLRRLLPQHGRDRAGDATGTFDECARIEDGAENNINTSLVFNNWVQDCSNTPGAGGTLSNEPSVGNDSVVIEAAQLDDILASQAAAASGLTRSTGMRSKSPSTCRASPTVIRRTSMPASSIPRPSSVR
jgi:hypothetical protein